MRPQGVSRSSSHCSFGTQSSGVRFWNFTASAPDSTAPSISFFAISSDPLWLIPISAITNTGSPSPTARSPIRTTARLMRPPPGRDPSAPLRRAGAGSTPRTPGTPLPRPAPGTRGERRPRPAPGRRRAPRSGPPVPPRRGCPRSLTSSPMYATSCLAAPAGGQDPRQLRRLVEDALEEVRQPQLLRPARHDGRALPGDDRRLDPRVAQPLDAHAVPEREALQRLAVLADVAPCRR